jgi:hypothetical protein
MNTPTLTPEAVLRLADDMAGYVACCATNFNSHNYDSYLQARTNLEDAIASFFEKMTPLVGS